MERRKSVGSSSMYQQLWRRGEKLLSPLDLRIVAAIKTLTDRLGYPPTLRQVAKLLDIASINALAKPLLKMRRLKVVQKQEPNAGRCLVLGMRPEMFPQETS